MSDLHLLGVRHHGPGSARSVVAALEEIRPSAVFVELPSDVQSAIDWIGEPGLVTPVALLVWALDEPARCAFVPLAEFSPEWQAVRWARRAGVAVTCIDRPMAITLAGASPTAERGRGAATVRDDPLAALAAAAGDLEPERWWEDVIEHRGDGVAAFGAVLDAMTEVRAGVAAADDDLAREAHMRRAIRAGRRRIDGPADSAVVVCGAWHAPVLDPSVTTAAADAAIVRGSTRIKVGVAWVPWTSERLARSSGYAAGVESPAWYDHVFREPGAAGAASFVARAARLLRERGLSASPDHVIASTRLADTLAALRDRPRPGLGEVLDAIDAVSGDVDLIRERLVIGRSIGAVPEGSPQVPLARDLAARQRRTRLRPDAEDRVVELDLRTPLGRARSTLLHQLAALGVWWGGEIEGRGSSGSFRETWRIRWRPELSVTIVERAALGTTVPDAAAAMLLDRAHGSARIGELVEVLRRAVTAGLHDVIAPVVAHVSTVAANDPDIGEVMDVLGPMADVIRYGDARATDVVAVRAVLDGLVVRVISGLPAACASLDDAAAELMVERLTAVASALSVLDHPARRGPYPRVLEELAEQRRGAGRVHGRATRLLHDAGWWGAAQVEQRLSRALSAGTPSVVGAAFLEGFLAGSGVVLVHDRALLDVIDRWLTSLSAPAFVDVVALLRRTFAAFDPAERRQLMALVTSEPTGTTELVDVDVDGARAAAGLLTVRRMLGLPVKGAGG